jgi:adenosylcobyric acid synthase
MNRESLQAEGSQNIRGKMNVYGTYMHGIFDGEGIAAAVVEALARKKGLTPGRNHRS